MQPTYLVPILTLKDDGGGAVALAFVRQMVAAGDAVMVLTSDFHSLRAAVAPENAGIRFVASPSPFASRALAFLAFLAYGTALSVLRRPRIVYTHIATGLIPNMSGRPAYMIAQDVEYRFYGGRARAMAKVLFARLLARCRLLVTSEWLAKFFRRRHFEIVHEGDVGISNAYCRSASRGPMPAWSQRPIDCLLIAKRGSHKRHAETLAVAKALAGKGLRVKLIDQRPDAYSAAQLAGVAVVNAVPAQAMRGLFGDSRLFISLSRAEGYGLTPLEALSQGCLVITTPMPSTAHVRHPSLTLVEGTYDLVERVVTLALEKTVAGSASSLSDSDATAYAGPFMEDWARSAFESFRAGRDDK